MDKSLALMCVENVWHVTHVRQRAGSAKPSNSSSTVHKSAVLVACNQRRVCVCVCLSCRFALRPCTLIPGRVSWHGELCCQASAHAHTHADSVVSPPHHTPKWVLTNSRAATCTCTRTHAHHANIAKGTTCRAAALGAGGGWNSRARRSAHVIYGGGAPAPKPLWA